MKKDKLREFVSANRDVFDDEQPGADILDKLHTRLKVEHPPAPPQRKIIKFRYRWAAAILIVGFAYLAVFQNNTSHNNTVSLKKEVKIKAPEAVPEQKTLRSAPQSRWIARHDPGKSKSVKKIKAKNLVAEDWAEDLKSESSSVRLSAVLKFGEKNAPLSDSDLRVLFTTMSSDESSNVRLAVLEVLRENQARPLVEAFILQSVSRQDDPVVQMELLSSLSLREAVKIKIQLLHLSQDPNHIDLVREEAYAVLFRSNIHI